MVSQNKVFADLPVTIFEAMSQAARDNNAINLGQGFPDDPGPEDIRREHQEALAAYEQALDKFDMDSAKIHLLGVHAAIHRFRWENNRLPASLAELKLTSLTTDPFTGAPLLYKVTGIAYELSSAGSAAHSDGSAGIGPIYLPRKPQ